MAILHASLIDVLERFPDLSEEIRTRFVKNETFKTICEDYQTCLKTVRHWNQLDGEYAQQRLLEYGELINELEEEILQSIVESRS